MTGDRDPTGFDRVLELPVAAFGRHQIPTIAFDQVVRVLTVSRALGRQFIATEGDQCSAPPFSTRPDWTRPSLIVRPEPDYFDESFFFQHLIHEPVLDVDPS